MAGGALRVTGGAAGVTGGEDVILSAATPAHTPARTAGAGRRCGRIWHGCRPFASLRVTSGAFRVTSGAARVTSGAAGATDSEDVILSAAKNLARVEALRFAQGDKWALRVTGGALRVTGRAGY